MKKKPYLISLASFTPGVERYISSLKNLKDSVELVYVDFVKHLPIPIRGLSEVIYLKQPNGYPGHHRRWEFIPKFLEEDRWWIFTDTQDVIFQGPIPDLDSFGADILVQYEGMTHEENGVWNQCITERWPSMSNLLPLPVYCCGVFATRGHMIREYQDYIKGYKEEIWDQIPFNQWIQDKSYKDCPELSAALFSNYYSGKLIDGHKPGSFAWKETGVVPAIVHGNGSSKELL